MNTTVLSDVGIRQSMCIGNHGHRRPVAVALGGGGARGLSHLGVMEAIGNAGVRTERIVGVSIGSLMGALCAIDHDVNRVQAKAIELLHSPVFSAKCENLMRAAERVGKRSEEQGDGGPIDWFSTWYRRLERMMRHGHRLTRIVSGPSILSSELLREAIDRLVPDINVNQTSTPLSIVAADLVSGQRVIIENGPLRKAILASMAIPGFFPPVPWEGMLLTDIGVLDSIPVQVAKSFAPNLTIAVDVGSSLGRTDRFRTTVDVMLRMEEIGESICRRQALSMADIVVRPEVGHHRWYDFTKPEKLIEKGRRAATKSLAGALVDLSSNPSEKR